MKNILVTGSEGYIGSVLVPCLVQQGISVVGVDTGFYADGCLGKKQSPIYRYVNRDIRELCESDFKNIDVVIHLAALCNDALGSLNEHLTYDVNYYATLALAKYAKKAGVKRFIFFSSCSLYGRGEKAFAECDMLFPQTSYAETKMLSERGIAMLASSRFSPVYMRNATVFGVSPRMRMDLVVNSLSGFAHAEGEIKILGDGTPWRPLVHIQDVIDVCIALLYAPKKKIHNQVFNVGSSRENYQIKTIAHWVQQKYEHCIITFGQKKSLDVRNYCVDFTKLNHMLGLRCKRTLQEGIAELADFYKAINLSQDVFNHRLFNRIKQIKYLLENKHLDENLLPIPINIKSSQSLHT